MAEFLAFTGQHVVLQQQKLCGMHIKYFMLINKKDLTIVKADQLNRRCIRALHVMKGNRRKNNNHGPTINQKETKQFHSFRTRNVGFLRAQLIHSVRGNITSNITVVLLVLMLHILGSNFSLESS
jgi:VanZ family protein